LFWRAGLATTTEGSVALMAGATLGGGTTVNYMNCVRPPELVRAEWARQAGLADLDGPAFDRHVEAGLAPPRAHHPPTAPPRPPWAATARCRASTGPPQGVAAGAAAWPPGPAGAPHRRPRPLRPRHGRLRRLRRPVRQPPGHSRHFPARRQRGRRGDRGWLSG